jgi:hypothetical protein
VFEHLNEQPQPPCFVHDCKDFPSSCPSPTVTRDLFGNKPRRLAIVTPFIATQVKRMIASMQRWEKHKACDVRRLASSRAVVSLSNVSLTHSPRGR